MRRAKGKTRQRKKGGETSENISPPLTYGPGLVVCSLKRSKVRPWLDPGLGEVAADKNYFKGQSHEKNHRCDFGYEPDRLVLPGITGRR